MDENMRRLEKILLETIERIANEPKSEVDIEVLPQLAQALVRLWEIR